MGGLYRDNASSDTRLEFAEELALGADRFPETKDVATAARAANPPLADAVAVRVKTEPDLRKTRVERRFREMDLEQTIRLIANDARSADGGRLGPVSDALFPDGLTAVVGPSGQAQLDQANALRKRIDGVAHPNMAAREADWVARLDAVITPLQAAEDAYRAAYRAWNDAFADERLRRDDHRRTMDKLIGLVRAAFPGDANRRAVIVPDVRPPKRDEPDHDEPGVSPS